MIDKRELALLNEALETLEAGFASLPEFDASFDATAMGEVLREVAARMQDNYPYFHPQYAGQMLKPPHPVARLAYMLSLWINPNNHALDGGIASSAMEKEAVAEIAAMFGFPQILGHLCGGGTVANMEALWVAGCLHPGRKILASSQAHYTHSRITEVLGLPFAPVATDRHGRMDIQSLRQALDGEDVGTVVATLGTTGLGAVDPLPDVLELSREFGFRVHVDAAYGGYYRLASELSETARAAYLCIPEADSIVVDPHKHGLQPYGCGCVLFSDPEVGRIYKHDSPYTYFSSAELHLGEISLECSRAGAAAVALWATQRLFPLTEGGEFAASLDSCLRAAREFHERLKSSSRYLPLVPPATDIVVYACRAASAKEASDRARAVFRRAAERELHLAMIQLPVDLVRAYWPDLQADSATVTCLRSCLMKAEHEHWIETICEILEAS